MVSHRFDLPHFHLKSRLKVLTQLVCTGAECLKIWETFCIHLLHLQLKSLFELFTQLVCAGAEPLAVKCCRYISLLYLQREQRLVVLTQPVCVGAFSGVAYFVTEFNVRGAHSACLCWCCVPRSRVSHFTILLYLHLESRFKTITQHVDACAKFLGADLLA